MKNLYQLITVMRQEPFLFEDTLRNNLTMFQPLSDQSLIEMLQSVGLHQFASVDKLDAMINPGGDNLSGGEKKRIGLARSLLRDSPILILDEPLANLDDENVSNIENLILSITDRTVIVISHQFSIEKHSSFADVITLR